MTNSIGDGDAPTATIRHPVKHVSKRFFNSETKVAVIFHQFGPYHWARLEAAARQMKVFALEVFAEQTVYPWDRVDRTASFEHVTLFTGSVAQVHNRQVKQALFDGLDRLSPDLVIIPGWAYLEALTALDWCSRRKVPAVVMSESTAWDGTRSRWKEWIKRRIVSLYSAAVVGGRSHADYLAGLGMAPDHVFCGYDAVDNDYFSQNATEVRKRSSEMRSRHGLPEKYFLASARFVEKKNLPRLLQAYAQYRALRQEMENESRGVARSSPWSLVLLGAGPLGENLRLQISALHLQDHVLLPGFKQYSDLPAYYALAGAFIHASATKPWGLVVNEAMASGLPVMVSRRCGCAADLVMEGKNGFTFDPGNVEALARLMIKISADDFPISEFGAMSRAIIARWGPGQFAAAMEQAARAALAAPPPGLTPSSRLLLALLTRRRASYD